MNSQIALMTPKIPFTKADAFEEEHYEAASIPPKWKRNMLNLGDHAKVETAGEKFWAQIAEKTPEGSYFGVVDSNLIWSHKHGLHCGDIIEFGPENIYDILAKT